MGSLVASTAANLVVKTKVQGKKDENFWSNQIMGGIK